MKKIFKLSALAVLAVGLLASCDKKKLAAPDVPVAGEARTFTLTFAKPDTKVAVTDEGKTTWEAGDEIMVHGQGSSNKVTVTLTADDISADGKTAVITVEGVTPYDRSDKGYTSTYYAQYPASLTPGGNQYYNAVFTSTNDFLLAGYNVGDTFVFYNLCGIISFKVEGEFDSYEFRGNNDETVAYTNFQSRLAATAGDPVLDFNRGSADGFECSPLTKVTGSLASGETAYVCLPGGANFTKGFTFNFLKEGAVVKTATTETAVNVERNKILPVGDITSKLEDAVISGPSDHVSELPLADAADLSVAGSANSYVITAPGLYKLPAVKGNSLETVGYVYGASVVWESYSNTEEVVEGSVIAAVDFEGEWVVFKTPDALKPGNALIAAKDARGGVLWSWHIWIPASAIETGTYGLSTHKLMDRNLGALLPATADAAITGEMFGLAYQWGRKDPFVSAGSLSVTTPATVAGTARTSSAGQMSISETIANPTVFANTTEKDWNLSPDNNLWSTEKTIYDPCPPGYRVPGTVDVLLFTAASVSDVPGWTYDVTTSHTFTAGDPATVFPIPGYLNYNNKYDNPGLRTKYYHAPATGDYAPALYVYNNDGSANYTANSGQKRGVGGSIRCITVEEASVEEPVDLWDYTPSAEYMAETNLWKAVFDADGEEVSGNIAGYEVKDITDVPAIVKSKSTYKMHFNGATSGDWANCNFLAPKPANAIALAAGKKYNFSYTIASSKDLPRAFLKMTTYDAGKTNNHEGSYIWETTKELTAETPVTVTDVINGVACDNISFTIDFGGNPENVDIYIKDIIIEEIIVPAKFQWREDSVAEQTVSNAAGAAHWYIDADQGVDFNVVVKKNDVETTEMVTVEKFETGGGHIAINFAENTSLSEANVWDITVTTEANAENKTLTAKLTQNPYEYTDLAKLNADIIASGTAKVDRVVNLASGVEITKISGKNVFAQNATGGILLYGTGLESKGMDENGGNAIIGKFTVTTTSYKGLPEITAVVSQSEDAKIGVWSGQYPCFNRTVAEIEADYAKFVNAKCKISNVEVTKPFGATKTGEIKDASGSLAIYNYATDLTTDIPAGTKAEYVIVWPTVFTTHQLGFYKASQLNITSMPSTITMPATKALGVGDTFELGATTVQPDATITYASSNEAVATVSAEGLVTAVAAGEATITASVAAKDKYEAAEATCVVTVTTEAPVSVSYTLDGAAIKAAHTASWSYTSGEKTITATDGSVWTAFNTYASKDQVTIQMNKGKSAYVLTPTVPTGKKITKITVVTNTKNDGTGEAGDRPLDILSADGSETLHSAVTNSAAGLSITGEHTALRVICNETSGGATYITSITVDFE